MKDDKLDDVARLLTVLIKLQAPSQAEAIREMSRSGLGQTRIAELLGTTPNTVNVTLQKIKRREKAT